MIRRNCSISIGSGIARSICIWLLILASSEAGARSLYSVASPPATSVIPVESKSDLQNLLDAQGTIYLNANADYRTGGIKKLVLSSNQRVIGGGYNTRVPPIEIAPNASNVVIDGVWGTGSTDWVVPDVTVLEGRHDDITIISGQYLPGGYNLKVKISTGAQLFRLKAHHIGGLWVDQSDSGFVRDSSFRFLLAYWPGPQVIWRGNKETPSFGNTFLEYISLGPSRGATWSLPGDLWLVTANAENYNFDGRGSKNPFQVTGATRIWTAMSGGAPSADITRSGALFHFGDTESVVAFGDRSFGGRADGGKDIVLDGVGLSAIAQFPETSSVANVRPPAGQLRILSLTPLEAPSLTKVNGRDISLGLTSEEKTALAGAYLGKKKATFALKASRKPISDMLGDSWLLDSKGRQDSSRLIQTMIDSKGIATLGPGVYYLDRPLRIGSTKRPEGVIGESPESVYLVAKGSFPVIQGRGNLKSIVGIQIALVGVSMYGGTHGLYLSNQSGNIGVGAQPNFCTFRDIRFMKQSVAGFEANRIYGMDNNIWQNVTFFRMPVAIKGAGSGTDVGMGYMDKQHFLNLQVVDISDTFWQWDSVRASGQNMFEDSYFENVGRLALMGSVVDTLWVNNVFKDVNGRVAIDFDSKGGTRAAGYQTFIDNKWTGRGPTVVTDTFPGNIGAIFIDEEFNQQGGSIVANEGNEALIAINSKISGTASAGLGLANGIFVNSALGGEINKVLTYCFRMRCYHSIDAQAQPYKSVLGR